MDRIVRLQADGGYTYVYVSDGKRHLVSRRMGELHAMLPAPLFFRCHHGHVVNLVFVIKLISTGGQRVIMANGDCVEVARRRWKELIAVVRLLR
jgi:two-component system LytT family response regulator